jgi:hypothetical protein
MCYSEKHTGIVDCPESRCQSVRMEILITQVDPKTIHAGYVLCQCPICSKQASKRICGRLGRSLTGFPDLMDS